MLELDRTIQQLARAAGFDLAGIAALDGTPVPQERPGYLEDWIASGHAGDMDYLKRRDDNRQLLRTSVQTAFPWAKSVVVCAVNYNAQAPRSIDPAPRGAGWIARYAWSGTLDQAGTTVAPTDYHDVLLKRLRRLESELRAALHFDQARSYVDTGPIIERAYARLAGLGWTGKNTCLIHQELGSWLFLGVIVTSYEVPVPIQEAARLHLPADRCGTCRRCIDACPTDALTPYAMDASRCIAYLTIEKRGPIPEELSAKMGRHVFGCDICQDVCPWNRRAPVTADPEFQARPELVNPALEWISEMDAVSFNRQFKGSPVKRTKWIGLQRNAAIAMGNSRDARFASTLEQWASQSEDAVVRETARSARTRLRASTADESAGESPSPQIERPSV